MKALAMALASTWSVSECVAQLLDTDSELPAIGRSLFDQLTGNANGYNIPYPYEKLVAQLRAQAGCASNECTQQVLIPLGRSLQRPAAIGEYFSFPRVVTAFTAEATSTAQSNSPTATLLLRDRLFLGYQENSDTIEVISYNDAAGRFEFQLVTNYHAGGSPRVNYATRAICGSCHQGLSPIFSRPLWQETNADPVIAARLRAHAASVHGVKAQVAIDEPQNIDAATDRANRLARAQAVWQLGCGNDSVARRCRAALLKAALQYRLSGNHHYDEQALIAARNLIAQRWQTQWPSGLMLPDNNLANRVPDLRYLDGQPQRAIYIAPTFDALTPRAPAETWRAFGSDQLTAVIADLAGFFTQRDIQALDRALQYANDSLGQRIVLNCDQAISPQGTQQRIDFECRNKDGAYGSGRIYLAGQRRGSLDSLRLGSAANNGFDGTASLSIARRDHNSIVLRVEREGLSLRDNSGRALSRVELNLQPSTPQLAITLDDGFARVVADINELAADDKDDALAALPFRRAAILNGLNRRSLALRRSAMFASCCAATAPLPPATHDAPELPATADRLTRTLQTWCSSCHASGERFPPSFLSGTTEQVNAKLRQCAPRIFQRLTMWRLQPDERNKTTMPPAAALANLNDTHQLASYRRSFDALADDIAMFARVNNIDLPNTLRASDGDTYELLPRCEGDSSSITNTVSSFHRNEKPAP